MTSGVIFRFVLSNMPTTFSTKAAQLFSEIRLSFYFSNEYRTGFILYLPFGSNGVSMIKLLFCWLCVVLPQDDGCHYSVTDDIKHLCQQMEMVFNQL